MNTTVFMKRPQEGKRRQLPIDAHPKIDFINTCSVSFPQPMKPIASQSNSSGPPRHMYTVLAFGPFEASLWVGL